MLAGIDLGGTQVRVALARSDGNLVTSVEGPIDLSPIAKGTLHADYDDIRQVDGRQLPHHIHYELDGHPLADERIRKTCILRDGVPWPVEINPRYTASVEVLEYACQDFVARQRVIVELAITNDVGQLGSAVTDLIDLFGMVIQSVEVFGDVMSHQVATCLDAIDVWIQQPCHDVVLWSNPCS